MNAVIISVSLMIGLSLIRLPIIIAIIVSAVCAGLIGDMSLHETLASFNQGIEQGASIALSYALLGALAAALAKTDIPAWYCQQSATKLSLSNNNKPKVLIILLLLIAAIFSQNIVPIHIAFIPIMVPALLMIMNRLHLDRRAIACVLTFGLVTTYMVLPVGFGAIYLNEILLQNLTLAGLDPDGLSVIKAMWIPGLGMLVGLLIALLFSYRKPRQYSTLVDDIKEHHPKKPTKAKLAITSFALIVTFFIQLWTDSMVMGALSGFVILTLFGLVKLKQSDTVFLDGIKMMAMIGFIMICSQGFSQVLTDTHHIESLVESASIMLENNQGIGIFLMLITGLIITMGIGSSFSTIPIIVTIFVPIALAMNFSPLAIMALIGTAGALGDAGSPASDSTLGPTSGLNADGQHDHIRDSVIPTFIHFNIPLLLFGWIAVMYLK